MKSKIFIRNIIGGTLLFFLLLGCEKDIVQPDIDAEIQGLMAEYNFPSVSPFFEDRIYAAGGLKTTLEDLSHFLMAYSNEGLWNNVRILNESSVDRLLEVQNPVTGTCLIWNTSIGGWVGHEGGLVAGASAIAEIQKANRLGFIIFCSKYPGYIGQGKELYGLVRQKANSFLK